jgi:hypothetical protein
MKKDSVKFKRNIKKCISVTVILIIFILLSFNIVVAQESSKMKTLLTQTGVTVGFSTTTTDTTLSENIGSIIKYLLSFLGVIFIILTIYGGFLWMTAAGDSEQITKAKDIIKSSIIGLIIIVAAYSLTYTLLSYVFVSTGM